jgi:hypothetical protein
MEMKTVLILAGLLFMPHEAGAQPVTNIPGYFNFDGTLLDSSNNPILSANVNFKLELMDAAGTCVLYSENHIVDLSTTAGAFSLKVGSGTTKANNLQGTASLSGQLFANSGSTGPFSGCGGGVVLGAGDGRQLRVSYDPAGGTSYVLLSPNFNMGALPYAMVAESLQGKAPSDLVQVRDDAGYDLNQSNIENVFSATNFAKLLQLLNNTFTASYSVNGQRLTNVAAPTAGTDAVNRNWSDGHVGDKAAVMTAVGSGFGGGMTLVWNQTSNQWEAGSPVATDATKLPLTGGTMSGAITMGSNNIVNAGHILMVPQAALKLGAYTTLQEAGFSGAGDEGKIWYNSDNDKLMYYDGVGNKTIEAAGSSITSLTGDVTTSGSGAAAATIANGVVTGAKIANDSISSAKIKSAGGGANRLLITDFPTGNNIVYKDDCIDNEILKWTTANGWDCAPDGGADNMGNHTASTNIILGSNWISGDGGAEGIRVDASGNVGIGTSAPTATLEVAGAGPGVQMNVTNLGSTSPWYPSLNVNHFANSYAGAPLVRMVAAQGTAAAPSPASAGQMLGSIQGVGQMSGAPGAVWTGGSIDFMAISAFAAGNAETAIAFRTAQSGSNTTAERMRIASNGNVGIGSTSPAYKLDVDGGSGTAIRAASTSNLAMLATSSGSTAAIQAINSSAAGAGVLAANSGAGYGLQAESSTGAPIRAMVSGSEVFRVDASGNVGIGTASPSANLEVSSASSSGTFLSVVNPNASSGTDNSILEIRNSYGSYPTSAPMLMLSNSGGTGASPTNVQTGDVLGRIVAFGHDGSSSEVGAEIQFRADQVWAAGHGSSIAFATVQNGMNTLSERMRIDNMGNVGIGTTSPAATMHVDGAGGFLVGPPGGGQAIMGLKICSLASSGGVSITGNTGSFTISCSNTPIGSVVNCSPDAPPSGNLVTWNAYVQTANTITVRYASPTASGSVANANWKCLVANN